jgi:tRNA pseudouridine38-40 synthase
VPGPKGPGICSFWGMRERCGRREVHLGGNHRMELQYDGTGLHGWAKQEGLSTVEGCLETALRTVLGYAPALRVAGRTDAGVHARRQVVSLRLPKETDLSKLAVSLNALTPPGIAIARIARAPEDFDARRNAVSRTYRYFLAASFAAAPVTAAPSRGGGPSSFPAVSPFWSRYCWHAPGTLAPHLLGAAAEATLGHHDFTAFTPAASEHASFRRLVLRCAWRRASGALWGSSGRGRGSGMLYLEIEADAFLRHMVRALVGTMVEVGEGRRELESYRGLLEGAARETAGPTAPAHGLFLWNVKYGAGARAGEGEETE